MARRTFRPWIALRVTRILPPITIVWLTFLVRTNKHLLLAGSFRRSAGAIAAMCLWTDPPPGDPPSAVNLDATLALTVFYQNQTEK
jgi:hypothetical protein